MNLSQICSIGFNQKTKLDDKIAIVPYVTHRFANVILMP
jgi:hypothetical protein